MIQGLRLLPFTADLPIFDCDKCQNGDKRTGMKPQPLQARRAQACGYMPHDKAVKRPWGVPLGVDFVPGEGDPDEPGFRPLCPGYLTGLPEVRETVQMRPHWLKGTLDLYLRGVEGDVQQALDAQAILDGAVTLKQQHDAEEAQRKAKEANGGR